MVAGMYEIRAEDDPATPLATVATLAAVDAALDRLSIEVGEQLAANGEGCSEFSLRLVTYDTVAAAEVGWCATNGGPISPMPW
jgi:hypothetical protein